MAILDDDCGGIQIRLCGNARRMISEMQFEEMKVRKRRRNMAHLIESVLEERAQDYFKNKSVEHGK